MHLRAILAMFGTLALVERCGPEPDEPVMTLSAAELTTPLDEFRTSESCFDADFPLESGQAFYLYHALPAKVVPPEPLQIDIETVCGNFPRNVDHVGGELLRVPLAAPEGAQCGVTVTATIANSIIRCELPPAASCAAFDAAQCPADDPSDTDTGDTTDGTDTTTG